MTSKDNVTEKDEQSSSHSSLSASAGELKSQRKLTELSIVIERTKSFNQKEFLQSGQNSSQRSLQISSPRSTIPSQRNSVQQNISQQIVPSKVNLNARNTPYNQKKLSQPISTIQTIKEQRENDKSAHPESGYEAKSNQKSAFVITNSRISLKPGGRQRLVSQEYLGQNEVLARQQYTGIQEMNKISNIGDDLHSHESAPFTNFQRMTPKGFDQSQTSANRQRASKQQYKPLLLGSTYKGNDICGQTQYLDATQVSQHYQYSKEMSVGHIQTPQELQENLIDLEKSVDTEKFNEQEENVRNQHFWQIYTQMCNQGLFQEFQTPQTQQKTMLKGKNMSFENNSQPKNQFSKTQRPHTAKNANKFNRQDKSSQGQLYAWKNSSMIPLSSPTAARDFKILKNPLTVQNFNMPAETTSIVEPQQLIQRTRRGQSKHLDDSKIMKRLQSSKGTRSNTQGILAKNPFIIRGAATKKEAIKQATEGLRQNGLMRFTNFQNFEDEKQRHFLLDNFVENLKRRNIMEKHVALQLNELNISQDIYQSVDTRQMDPSRLQALDPQLEPQIDPQGTPPLLENNETQITQDIIETTDRNMQSSNVPSVLAELQAVAEQVKSEKENNSQQNVVCILSKQELLEETLKKEKTKIQLQIQGNSFGSPMVTNLKEKKTPETILMKSAATSPTNYDIMQLKQKANINTLMEESNQKINKFQRMTASDDEESHDEDKEKLLLRPSSVVRTEILTRNGSSQFKADIVDPNLLRLPKQNSTVFNLVSPIQSIKNAGYQQQVSPPSARKNQKKSPRGTRKPLTKSQYYSNQRQIQKNLNSDLPGAIQNIVVYDQKKSTEGDLIHRQSNTEISPGVEKSKVRILKSKVPITQSGEFQVKRPQLTFNSRNIQTQSASNINNQKQRRCQTGRQSELSRGKILTNGIMQLKSQDLLPKQVQFAPTCKGDVKKVSLQGITADEIMSSTQFNSDSLSNGIKSLETNTREQPITMKKQNSRAQLGHTKNGRAFKAVHSQTQPHKLKVEASHRRKAAILSNDDCMIRTKAINPCNGDTSEYVYDGNAKNLTIFNSDYIQQTILKEVRSHQNFIRPVSGGYKKSVRQRGKQNNSHLHMTAFSRGHTYAAVSPSYDNSANLLSPGAPQQYIGLASSDSQTQYYHVKQGENTQLIPVNPSQIPTDGQKYNQQQLNAFGQYRDSHNQDLEDFLSSKQQAAILQSDGRHSSLGADDDLTSGRYEIMTSGRYDFPLAINQLGGPQFQYHQGTRNSQDTQTPNHHIVSAEAIANYDQVLKQTKFDNPDLGPMQKILSQADQAKVKNQNSRNNLLLRNQNTSTHIKTQDALDGTITNQSETNNQTIMINENLAKESHTKQSSLLPTRPKSEIKSEINNKMSDSKPKSQGAAVFGKMSPVPHNKTTLQTGSIITEARTDAAHLVAISNQFKPGQMMTSSQQFVRTSADKEIFNRKSVDVLRQSVEGVNGQNTRHIILQNQSKGAQNDNRGDSQNPIEEIINELKDTTGVPNHDNAYQSQIAPQDISRVETQRNENELISRNPTSHTNLVKPVRDKDIQVQVNSKRPHTPNRHFRSPNHNSLTFAMKRQSNVHKDNEPLQLAVVATKLVNRPAQKQKETKETVNISAKRNAGELQKTVD